MLRASTWLVVVLVCYSGACYSSLLWADEPNNTFDEATVLAPGVLSVSDELVSNAVYPDTMVASLSSFGTFITDFNDDGGPWEGSLGSGLTEIPINNDSSILFLVSGNPDFDFVGDHSQSGDYHVYVDIYDDFGDFVDTFEYDNALSPGEVDQFYLDGFNTNYTYDVFIDNTLGGASGSDVDFFTFTGLEAGASFTVEVTQEFFDGFDSYLGWFDDSGNLIDTDDDGGFEKLSLLQGNVPANGQLTFAVTGFEDDDFQGNHSEDATYALELTIDSSVGGDFDGDGDVDGRDFLVWQRNPSVGTLAAWQANYGVGSLAAVAAVPEPGTCVLFWIFGMGAIGQRDKSRR